MFLWILIASVRCYPRPGREPDSTCPPKQQRPAIEGKREDETMREFNQRVKEGTARLLKENVQENSATRKKKKR